LIAGGLLRRPLGDRVTRLAGAGAARVVLGFLYVAYWAPPLDRQPFNPFLIILIATGLYLALWGRRGPQPGRLNIAGGEKMS
jgi:hypothetical protein